MRKIRKKSAIFWAKKKGVAGSICAGALKSAAASRLLRMCLPAWCTTVPNHIQETHSTYPNRSTERPGTCSAAAVVYLLCGTAAFVSAAEKKGRSVPYLTQYAERVAIIEPCP